MILYLSKPITESRIGFLSGKLSPESFLLPLHGLPNGDPYFGYLLYLTLKDTVLQSCLEHLDQVQILPVLPWVYLAEFGVFQFFSHLFTTCTASIGFIAPRT